MRKDWPVSAVKLVDGLAGESPASASFPVGAVVISGDGAGDQAIGSPEVNVLVGRMRNLVSSEQEGKQSSRSSVSVKYWVYAAEKKNSCVHSRRLQRW
jgi:hypothetical protein